jgi:translation initiation factor 5
MPIIRTTIEGRGNGIRTLVSNMELVMKALDRPMEYGAKFISIELGTKSKCNLLQGSCVFAGNHSTEAISVCLDKFINMYVICTKCSNPETILRIKKNNLVSKCLACGTEFKIDPSHQVFNFIKADISKKTVLEKKPPPKKKVEIYDPTEPWTLGTSKHEVSLRKQQLLNIDGNNLVYPTENLLKYLQTGPSETEYTNELLKLMESQSWSATVLIKYVFATLFSDGNIKYNFNKKVIYLEYIVNTENDMVTVLMCIEKFIEEHMKYVEDIVHILNGFYEFSVIDENVIIKWHNSKSKVVSEELSKIIKDNSEPFVKWLNTDL